MYDDFSLIIQGPISDINKLDFMVEIEQYKNVFPEIILSTYIEQVTQNIIDFCVTHNIKLVTQTINIDERLRILYNLGYQMLSSLNGLRTATKKYAVKHRTDERYTNIHKLLDKFLEDDEKWVTGSMCILPASKYHFHWSDHLCLSKREKMIKVYELTVQNILDDCYERSRANEPAAELTVTRNIIRINGEEPDINKYDEQMLKYFNFVNDTEMHPFIIRCNHGNICHTDIGQMDMNGVNDMVSALHR